ncbi:histidine kinase [Nonomuraea sp. NPDC026600]|uniref:sensor histidine kinase n=1 Tax=Nonomuraea sp. NPDC026600 TaxID=3155363 RepID=UPI00340B15F0
MTEHTHSGDGRRRPFRALSRMARLGDVPVVIMLAWAGWLAVPWSFSGLAQARAAAAAAAAEAEPPPVVSSDAVRAGTSTTADVLRGGTLASATPAMAWGIPAHSVAPAPRTVRASRGDAPGDGTREDELGWALCDDGAATAVWPLHDNATAVQPLHDEDVRRPFHGQGAPPADVLAVERARIVGEVHDAAGHGLAAIAMQAGLALITLDDNPEQARASLLAIKETSTTALTQLRAALDRLDPRDSTHDLGASAHDLPGLIDGVRAAGLPVDVEPADPTVPAHLSATVYGVVRESLTNVLRHAGPTRALVRLSGDPAGLVLEIADRGAGRPGAAEGRGWSGTAEGRGLAGMRARVIAAGGHFTAGPRDGGGFQVLATFPENIALQSTAFQSTASPSAAFQSAALQSAPSQNIALQSAASQSVTLQSTVDHRDTSDRLSIADSPADLT